MPQYSATVATERTGYIYVLYRALVNHKVIGPKQTINSLDLHELYLAQKFVSALNLHPPISCSIFTLVRDIKHGSFYTPKVDWQMALTQWLRICNDKNVACFHMHIVVGSFTYIVGYYMVY